MYRSLGWLTVLLVLAGCRQTRSEAGRDDSPDLANRTGSAELDDSEAGVEFEAPRLIPAVRAQITQVSEPEGATEGNLTAFRNGVGALVNAMEADLNRIGASDTDLFYELSDSVMREFGGGAGEMVSIPPEKRRVAVANVERLIGVYEELMRKGRK
jgi:hypothetical protein